MNINGLSANEWGFSLICYFDKAIYVTLFYATETSFIRSGISDVKKCIILHL